MGLTFGGGDCFQKGDVPLMQTKRNKLLRKKKVAVEVICYHPGS